MLRITGTSSPKLEGRRNRVCPNSIIGKFSIPLAGENNIFFFYLLLVERLEERCESFKRESSDLHNRNIELVKKHQYLKETAAALRISESRSRSTEDASGSPLNERAPGFQDFTSPSKGGKKKRQLPIAPRRRPRAESTEEGTVMCVLCLRVCVVLAVE